MVVVPLATFNNYANDASCQLLTVYIYFYNTATSSMYMKQLLSLYNKHLMYIFSKR